jgi:hypothetical protein
MQMRFIRKLFFCSITVLLIWLGIFTYNRFTDGFSIHQMTSTLPPCPQFDIDVSEEKKAALQTLLDQKFYYLGKGCQFYVFESEDRKYVLKFFKHKHLRQYTWLNTLPLPQKLHTVCQAKIVRRAERVERLFTSCKLAYEKMPEESGLLFLHLNRTPALENSVVIVDKIGCHHTLNLDNFEYCVQKKGEPLKEVFGKIGEEELPLKIQQLVDLVFSRCEKGIGDRDRAFVQNVAFTEQGAIFTDIGQFYTDPTLVQKEEQVKDLKGRMASLYLWTKKHFPHFAKCITEMRPEP